MSTKVAMWGNSLAVRIPKELAKPLNLEPNTPVVLEVTPAGLVIRPESPYEIKLRTMFAGYSKEQFEHLEGALAQIKLLLPE